MIKAYLIMCAIVMAFTLVWGVYNIAPIIIKAHKRKKELEEKYGEDY
jgi:hypothetical protein